MKKIFLAIAAVAAMTLASCGNKANQEASAADSTATDSDSITAVDTTALAPEAKQSLNSLTAQLSNQLQAKDSKGMTTTLATIQATYKALVNADKLDDAKTYGKAVQNFIAQNAEAIKTVASGNTTINDLVEGIKKLPTTAETTAEQAKQAVTDDAVSLAAPYIQKAAATSATAATAAAALKNVPAAAAAAVEAAPAAAKTAAENAANAAVNTAKTAAENKVNSEVNKAQTKAAEKVEKAQNKAAEKVEKAQKKANDEVNKAANKALKGLGL